MDFAGMIDTWRRVLTQPGEETFHQEKTSPNATLVNALIWIVIAAVITSLLGALQGMLGLAGMGTMLDQADLPPGMADQFSTMFSAGMMGAGSLAGIILIPLFFLVSVFIIHFIAQALGGQGDYSVFAYLYSTFQAPISVVSAVLAFIPFLGSCLGFLLTIYTYVLAYFAVRANYGLSQGKAIIVVLIPLAVIIVLGLCVAFAGMAALMAGA